MKILLAIQSEDYRKVDNALRWTGRLGYDLRVFTSKRNKRKKYVEALADANYNWYLALESSQIITKKEPYDYAKDNGYSLLVYIPEDLLHWNKRLFLKPDEINNAYAAIGNARGEFRAKPKKRIKRWTNGCTMVRVT